MIFFIVLILVLWVLATLFFTIISVKDLLGLKHNIFSKKKKKRKKVILKILHFIFFGTIFILAICFLWFEINGLNGIIFLSYTIRLFEIVSLLSVLSLIKEILKNKHSIFSEKGPVLEFAVLALNIIGIFFMEMRNLLVWNHESRYFI